MDLEAKLNAYFSSVDERRIFDQFMQFPDLCAKIFMQQQHSLDQLQYNREQRTEFQAAFHQYHRLLQAVVVFFDSSSFAKLVDAARSGLRNTREQLAAELVSRRQALQEKQEELAGEEEMLAQQEAENKRLQEYIDEFTRRRGLCKEDLANINELNRQLEKEKEALEAGVPLAVTEQVGEAALLEKALENNLQLLNRFCRQINAILSAGIREQVNRRRVLEEEIKENLTRLKEIQQQHEIIALEHGEILDNLMLHASVNCRIMGHLGETVGDKGPEAPAVVSSIEGKMDEIEKGLNALDAAIREIVVERASRQERLRRARRPGT